MAVKNSVVIVEHDDHFAWYSPKSKGSEPFLGNKSNALNVIMKLIYDFSVAEGEPWGIRFALKEEDEMTDKEMVECSPF